MKRYFKILILIGWAFTFSAYDGCATNPEVDIRGPFPSWDACNNARSTYGSNVQVTTTMCWKIPEPPGVSEGLQLDDKGRILE